MGHCYLYGRGQATPLSSCPIPCGVQQGDVFGPLFFALGLDELLRAIRARMRNLPVDSTFVGQRVFVSELAMGTLVEGDHHSAVPLQAEMPLTLVGAPSYADVEAAGDVSSLRVVVRVGEGESSYCVEVAWSAVRFGAEILLAAYLDYIHSRGTLFSCAHLRWPSVSLGLPSGSTLRPSPRTTRMFLGFSRTRCAASPSGSTPLRTATCPSSGS